MNKESKPDQIKMKLSKCKLLNGSEKIITATKNCKVGFR